MGSAPKLVYTSNNICLSLILSYLYLNWHSLKKCVVTMALIFWSLCLCVIGRCHNSSALHSKHLTICAQSINPKFSSVILCVCILGSKQPVIFTKPVSLWLSLSQLLSVNNMTCLNLSAYLKSTDFKSSLSQTFYTMNIRTHGWPLLCSEIWMIVLCIAHLGTTSTDTSCYTKFKNLCSMPCACYLILV